MIDTFSLLIQAISSALSNNEADGPMITDWIQAAASIGSFIVSFFTIRALILQKEANEQQQKSLDYLIKKDRADYAPRFSFPGRMPSILIFNEDNTIPLTLENFGKEATKSEVEFLIPNTPRNAISLNSIPNAHTIIITLGAREINKAKIQFRYEDLLGTIYELEISQVSFDKHIFFQIGAPTVIPNYPDITRPARI